MSWLSKAFKKSTGMDALGQGVAGAAAASQGRADQRMGALTAIQTPEQRAAGALGALDARHAALIDPTKRSAFGATAARGFFGGLADQSVRSALGDLDA